MKIAKIGLFLGVVLAFGLVYKMGWHQYLTLEALKENKAVIQALYNENKTTVIAAFMGIYVLTTAISIPGASILTLSGGALFGPFAGTGIIVISATIGATLAFLGSRFVARDALESKYETSLAKFNKGLSKNAVNYLLFLRLVPLFPFFLINLVTGLTRVSIPVFMGTTLVGIAPGTFVYANAGSQLAQINSVGEIASPGLLGAFALLGCFALIPTLYQKLKGSPL